MTTDCKQQSVVHFLSTFLPYTQPLVSLQSTSIPCFMHGDPALCSVVLCYVLFPDKDQTGWQVVCIYAAFKRRCMASFWLLLHKNNLDLRTMPTVDRGRKWPQASMYVAKIAHSGEFKIKKVGSYFLRKAESFNGSGRISFVIQQDGNLWQFLFNLMLINRCCTVDRKKAFLGKLFACFNRR